LYEKAALARIVEGSKPHNCFTSHLLSCYANSVWSLQGGDRILCPFGDMALKYTLYRPAEMSAELWQAYTALRDARAIYDDPFFDPDFARLVGEVREDTRIGVAFEGDKAVAFWPLHERPGHWARPIGGPFSDWHAPVVEAGRELCPVEFLSGLGLSGMTAFGYMPTPECRIDNMQRVGANMTDLSMGWDAYLDQQQRAWPKHFKKMRRVYRGVERDFSEAQYEWDDKSDIQFDRLMKLKYAQFERTGFHNVLKPDWSRALLDRLRHFEGPRLRARLVTLNYDGEQAAAEFNLQSDKVMHGWLTSFDQRFSSYSPGNQVLQNLLESMTQESLGIYDAGPGLDHYKRHYANYYLPVEIGVLRGRRGSYAPSRIVGRVWRRAERDFPGKAAAIMARVRRRMDQIALAEPTVGARISGIWGALSHRGI